MNEIATLPKQEIQRSEQQSNVLDIARQLIQDKQIPAESIPALMSQMFDFQLKVKAVESEESFNRDFAAAKREMPAIQKNGKVDMGGKGSYDFAKYDDVCAAISPIEQRYGFARSFESVATKDGVHLRLVMRHRDGHVDRSSSVEMPPDTGAGRNGMQARRSSSSYAKRGLTLDYWDLLSVGADNDGATAEPLSREQVDHLTELLEFLEMKKDDSAFLKFAEVASFSKIQRPQFDRILAGLQKKARAKEAQQ